MKPIIAKTYPELKTVINDWKAQGLTIGFVPTMGALHDGHLSLVDIAKSQTDKCVVSIYVNPTQFAPHEDFDAYPRNTEDDCAKLATKGADLIYLPTKDNIYPDTMETSIKPGLASEGLDTDFRPHFFHGVVNVVTRLFEQVKPDIAVFGEKDFQQLQIIRDVVRDYNLPLKIIGGPIMREKDGLAMASRNAYLKPKDRSIARMLNKILFETARKISKNPHQEKEVMENAATALKNAGFDKVDYISARWGRVLGAGWVGQTRLIDNVAIE